MDAVVTVVIMPVLLMAAIIGLFYLFFGRRGGPAADPPGLRSFVSFVAPHAFLEEAAGDAVDDAEPAHAGGPLSEALRRGLIERACDVGAPEHESYGFSFEVGCGEEAFCVRLGWLGDENEDGGRLDWLLSVDPQRGPLHDGPGLRRLLAELHATLDVVGATERRWHAREDWNAGRTTGTALPLES